MVLGLQLAKNMPEHAVSSVSAKLGQPASVANTGVDLPRAMTATPREKQAKTISYTNDSLLVELQRQVDSSDAQAELKVQSVEISEEYVRIVGWVGGLDWHGPVEITGVPMINNGELQFQLQDVLLADQTLPTFMTANIETEIQQIFQQWLWGHEILGLKLGVGKIDLTVVDW